MPAAFPFIVLSDLHYTTPEDRPWLEALIRTINNHNPDLVLVLGDLAETGSREELAAAKSILNNLRAPWYPVPGNHDGPPNRPINTGPAGLADYESLFPNRRNYHFIHQSWQFLALDTTNGSGYQNLPIPDETLAFAAKAARELSPNLPTILFTHLPLEPTVRFSSSDGYKLLDLLAPLNLRIVFSGHFHGLTCNPAPKNKALHLLTTQTCSRAREIHDHTTARGYLLCHANTDQSVSHQFIEYKST